MSDTRRGTTTSVRCAYGRYCCPPTSASSKENAYVPLTTLLQVYDLPFASSSSSRVGMSSYPLAIVSSDDFVYTNQQVPPASSLHLCSAFQFYGFIHLYLTPNASCRLQSCLPKYFHHAPTPTYGPAYCPSVLCGRISAMLMLPELPIQLLAGRLRLASISRRRTTTSGLLWTTRSSRRDSRRRLTPCGSSTRCQSSAMLALADLSSYLHSA